MMKQKNAKKSVRKYIGKVKATGRQVDHFQKVLDGFNKLQEMKAIRIEGETIHLFRELWGKDSKNAAAWMKNAYIYFRVKLDVRPDTIIFFRDIETDEEIGMYVDGEAVLM